MSYFPWKSSSFYYSYKQSLPFWSSIILFAKMFVNMRKFITARRQKPWGKSYQRKRPFSNGLSKYFFQASAVQVSARHSDINFQNFFFFMFFCRMYDFDFSERFPCFLQYRLNIFKVCFPPPLETIGSSSSISALYRLNWSGFHLLFSYIKHLRNDSSFLQIQWSKNGLQRLR